MTIDLRKAINEHEGELAEIADPIQFQPPHGNETYPGICWENGFGIGYDKDGDGSIVIVHTSEVAVSVDYNYLTSPNIQTRKLLVHDDNGHVQFLYDYTANELDIVRFDTVRASVLVDQIHLDEGGSDLDLPFTIGGVTTGLYNNTVSLRVVVNGVDAGGFTDDGDLSSERDLIAGRNLLAIGYLLSAATTGTVPVQVSSTTLCPNLNSDLLDGQQGSYYLALSNATGALANSQLADMAQATIKGRASGAGTGSPTDLSGSQVASILSGNASLTQLTTSNQYITSTGGIRFSYASDTHGITNKAETNTFAWVTRYSNSGGCYFLGINKATNEPCFTIDAVHGTTGTPTIPLLRFIGSKKAASGPGTQALASSDLLFDIRNNTTTAITLYGNGDFYIGGTLDINSNKLRLRTSKTPSSPSDTGNAGDICWDADYVYWCYATNSWNRAARDASWV